MKETRRLARGRRKRVQTAGYAFLFRDAARGESGLGLDEAFLRALREADPGGTVSTRIYRGGILIRQLAYKATAVKLKPRGPVHSKRRAHPQAETTEQADMGLYATLVGDLVDSLLPRWNTVDRSSFANLIANHAVDATFLSSVSSEVAARIDQTLRSYPRYLGALNPDKGNPLHLHLFVEMMFKNAFIRNGQVFLEGPLPGVEQASFPGAEKFSPYGMVVVPYADFESAAPDPNIPSELSARGLITQRRMRRRMTLTVHERLMAEIRSSRFFEDALQEFEWDLKQLPNAAEEVDVQARKLTDYLLARDHKRGRSKAEFFSSVLEIERGDWQFLHAQLVDGLRESTFEDVRLDQHGIRFSAILPVKGRNGATATIKSAWIVRPGERASLVTAVPTKKDAALERAATEPKIVGQDLVGDKRWEAIFALATQAGIEGGESTVPKPLVVEGTVYMEGKCGGAYVVVADGRHKFSRWLRKSGRGTRHYPTGCRISAPSPGQSADWAAGYAAAFALVLLRNGIPCRAETYLT
jgi:hypothetical protein